MMALMICCINGVQSKWVIAVVFGALLLWRHDAEAVWAAIGSILNSALSVALKRLLNQERPLANVRSDPGMPSSHAQSIFYAVTFFIMSSNSLQPSLCFEFGKKINSMLLQFTDCYQCMLLVSIVFLLVIEFKECSCVLYLVC